MILIKPTRGFGYGAQEQKKKKREGPRVSGKHGTGGKRRLDRGEMAGKHSGMLDSGQQKSKQSEPGEKNNGITCDLIKGARLRTKQ